MPPVMVGREREEAGLRQSLAALLAGHGSVVLISGQSGMGKTTLVDWFAQSAEAAGSLVLRSACYDLTSTPPYGPWLEIVRDYAARESVPPPPAFLSDPSALEEIGSQEALFDRIAAFLRTVADARPLILILEDLHWADAGTIGLLRAVGRHIARQRIMLVATYRSDDLTRDDPLFRSIPLIVRETGAERYELRSLTSEDSLKLVRSLYVLGDSDRQRLEQFLSTRSEGNPLYLHELLRTLEENGVLIRRDDGTWELGDPDALRVPAFVLQVIELRLGRLDEGTRELLQIAAVIGDEVPVDIWQQVSEATSDRLIFGIQQGLDANLIEEVTATGGYRFRHGLLRQALYQEAIVPRRRTWHWRAAEVLEQRARSDPDAVAFHYLQAQDDRALSWLIKAGERAERAYAWMTAADRFETAMHILDARGAPARDRAWMRFRIAYLRRYTDPAQAISLLQDSRRIAQDAGESAIAGYALFSIGALRCFLSDVRNGLPTMEQAVTEFHGLPEQEQATMASIAHIDAHLLEARLIPWLATAGRFSELIELAGRVLDEWKIDTSSPASDRPTLAGVHYGVGLAQAALGHPDLARQSFQEARRIYEALSHHTMLAIVCANELEALRIPYFPEDREGHERLAAAGEESARLASGAIPDSISPRYVSLDLMVEEGLWRDARAIALAANNEQYSTVKIVGCRCLARLAHYQGDDDLAVRLIENVLPRGPATEPGSAYILSELVLVRLAAEIAVERDELDNARTWLEAHDRWLDRSGAVLGRAEGELGWATYFLRLGDNGAASARLEQALQYASDPRQPLALAAIHRMLGRVDVDARRFTPATDHLDQSLALAEASGSPFERARTLIELARLHAGRGDNPAGLALLDEARQICETLGAHPTAVRIDHLISRLSAERQSAPVYPAGLTVREIEVLRLVAQGMTDAEVADQLFLSPRTVSAHLRSIYNKIGVGSRAAATRFAAEHGLI